MKKAVIILIAALVAISLIINYPIPVLIVLAIAATVYFLIRRRKKQAEAEKEAARKAEEDAQELERQKKEEAIQKELAKRAQRFIAEIEAIPQAVIAISAPAPRQYLKDMPDLGYSSITKTTKLSAIFPLVFLDVETTGLYPAKSEIVEVAAIKFDAGMNPTACFSTLCKPKKPIPPEITKINGITDGMVEDKPNFHEIAHSLSQFLEGCNLAGHNLMFDLEFLYVHGTSLPFDKKLYDTLELAQRTIKKSDIGNHKLGTVCDWYGIHRGDAHRALSDSYATSKIFTQLVFDKTSRMLDDGSNIVSDSDT